MIEDLELFETKSWRTKAEIGNSKYRKRFENDSTYVASVDEFRGLGVKWKKNRRKLLPWISPPNRRERENSILFSRIDRFATIYDTVDEERIVKNLDATSKQYRCIFVDDQCIVPWWNELLLSYLHHMEWKISSLIEFINVIDLSQFVKFVKVGSSLVKI